MQAPEQQERFWNRSRLRQAFFSLMALCLCAVLATAALLHYYNGQLPPDLRGVSEWKPQSLTQVYSADGELIGEFYLQRRTPVPISRIPIHVQRAFLAAEDGGFYEHPGLDFLGIARAAVVNLLAGRVVQGGSTITQQVVKNLLLTPERSLSRKIKEALLSLRLERELSKQQILETYLNLIYLGQGAYGVQSAAQAYFGKDVEQLSVSEAALLAGIVQAPSRLSPFSNLKAAKQRQNYVLQQMVSGRSITEGVAEEQKARSLTFLRTPQVNRQAAPDFVELVRRKVQQQFGQQLYTGGLTIHTTLDMALQRTMRNAVKKGVQGVHNRQGYLGPLRRKSESLWNQYRQRSWRDIRSKRRLHGFPGDLDDPPKDQEIIEALVVKKEAGAITMAIGPHEAKLYPPSLNREVRRFDPQERWKTLTLWEDIQEGDVLLARWIAASEFGPVFDIQDVPSAQAAAVSMDVHSGEILAMIGGYDPKQSRFNRVTQSYRQPGSTFKPLIYAAAIEEQYNQTSVIHDRPLSFRLSGNRYWRPHNYNHRYYGKITLRTALAKSLNSAAVQILQSIGTHKVISLARRLGITAPLVSNLTLALGSSEVSLMQMTTAYGGLANGGKPLDVKIISHITGPDGEVLLDQRNIKNESMPALSRESAFIISDMLKAVATRGTARKAKALKREVGGKTGTTNQYRDAWFLGYSPDIVSGVWVGTDGHHPLGQDETGGGTALPIWLDIMSTALKDKANRTFPLPPGIVYVHGDPERGTPPTKGRRSAHMAVHIHRASTALRPIKSRVVAEVDSSQ